MKIHLLIIDPQNDFCDPSGALFVPGADKDMSRLSAMVRRLSRKIDDIHVTLDSHRQIDIAHPTFWMDSAGNEPPPFTMISAEAVRSGIWTTRFPGYRARALAYLEALEAQGRYPHTIWPIHCLIGSKGHGVHPDLFSAIQAWERDRFAITNFVTKGSNLWTEHFSAVKAEVPDPADPSTQINTGLISTLEDADILLLAGEALSHCLANTVRDVADNFSDPKTIGKMVLLTDCTSPVPDPPGAPIFTEATARFMSEMTARGMKTAKSTEFLI